MRPIGGRGHMRDHPGRVEPHRNSREAGADPQSAKIGTGWLASLLHRLSGAISRRDCSADAARPPVGRDTDVLIAKRALRLHNRNPDGAAAYERMHTILNRGPQ